jgi:hypothetical protein
MNLVREAAAMRSTHIDTEGQTLILSHPSVAHQQELQRIITKLRPALVKLLNNNAFTFDFQLKAADGTTQNELYTDSDKLKYLLTQYPELEAWRQELGLDLI